MEKLCNGGRIIGLSTPGVSFAASPRSFYFLPGCAKASVEYMARHYAKELAPKRITVNVVISGITDTDAWIASPPIDAVELPKLRCPMKEVIPPSDVGAAVAFLVSKQARFITGAFLLVDCALMFV
ncbi:uncharacterized protein LOC135471011 [Liolophura sinensis]|uniref:uncharacterized protein LOC135471011 n=1 Tax=Liolophura sinensis TaxID=3198878 RepID=UPI003158C634